MFDSSTSGFNLVLVKTSDPFKRYIYISIYRYIYIYIYIYLLIYIYVYILREKRLNTF